MAREVQDLTDYSVAELVDIVVNSEKRYKTFLRIPTEKKGLVFLNLPSSIKQRFSVIMKVSRILKILKYLDEADIVDFLEIFTETKRKKILSEFTARQKKNYEFLLQFEADSAAGLMNLNFMIVETKDVDYDSIKRKLEWYLKRNNNNPPLIVVQEKKRIKGIIPVTNFILSKPDDLVSLIQEVPVVKHHEDYEDVLDEVSSANAQYVIVIDDEDAVLGYIESSNLFRIVEEKSTEELYKFAGVNKEEDIYDSAKIKIKSRYVWLLINLLTAFLAASVIGLFEDTIQKMVLLAVYIPIIAGMGGNAATQTLAVVIRGIAVHEISSQNRIKIIVQEVLAGIANGFIIGVAVALAAWLFNGLALLGVVVFLSMVANLIIAAFFGTITPFILKKLNIDPAVAGTVVVTTATDVFGFFVFLGLAEIILL